MNKEEIIQEFRLHKGDKSSVGVEIGELSEKIQRLEDFIAKIDEDHPCFLSYRLNLIKLVNSRRRLLNLLLSTNTGLHNKIKNKLERTHATIL